MSSLNVESHQLKKSITTMRVGRQWSPRGPWLSARLPTSIVDVILGRHISLSTKLYTLIYC
jgi:hypothetical protein